MELSNLKRWGLTVDSVIPGPELNWDATHSPFYSSKFVLLQTPDPMLPLAHSTTIFFPVERRKKKIKPESGLGRLNLLRSLGDKWQHYAKVYVMTEACRIC